MAESLIKIRNLTKSFTSAGKTTMVLNHIDLTVTRGQFVALEGRSGSGKSTLLSIIGLLDVASSGNYQLCDCEVSGLSAYQQSVLRNQHIGWVFQNFNLIPDMSVAENLMLPLRYCKDLDKSCYSEMVENVLEKVELQDKRDLYPEQLSGGQQQKVAIARALITQPELILADEPTGNLDSHSAAIILQLLQQLHQQGVTIIMVTHSSELAIQCEYRYVMQDGVLSRASISTGVCV